MQHLIDRGQLIFDDSQDFYLVDFVRLKEALEVKIKQRKPKPPHSPDEPPPQIRNDTDVVNIDNAFSTDFKAPLARIDINRMNSFRSDGEYLPIVKVKSVYPRQALQKDLFGWVLVEFIVDQNGRVSDPVIIDNCVDTYRPGGSKECVDNPGKMFNGPTMVAVKKYKYKPKIVDGVTIDTHGVQNKVFFTLNEMC